MQGSDNADIWRFERDQCRKQLSEAMLRIEELERLWLYPERWVVGRPNQEPVEEIHLTIEQHETLVARIDELEAGILAVATELLPRIENGLDLGEGYTMLRHLAEAIPRQALGDNDE